MAETGWGAKADSAGFLAVLPEGLPPDPASPPRFLQNPPLWNDGSGRTPPREDVAFVAAVIDDLAAQHLIDTRRVFVTGFSNGAGLAFRVAAELSPRIAAVAPVAGHCWLSDPRPEMSRATLFLIGDADPLVPLAGGTVTTPWGRTEVRPSVAATLEKWAMALGCALTPRRAQDGEVREDVYGPGREGVTLRAITIAGLGHHWPGGRGELSRRLAGPPSDHLNATDVIWEFFRTIDVGS
jgi:polyhydroxybutyrate depolymerase